MIAAMPIRPVNTSLLIIVPTLNSYQLLSRFVSSLKDQSWTGWRVVFVDGPSSLQHRKWLESCCIDDFRFQWIEQSPHEPGIFGAMNQGFSLAGPADWLLFWGSDDWAASPSVLGSVVKAIEFYSSPPDLLVCQGRYVNARSGVFSRLSIFRPKGLLSSSDYRHFLFFGSTPPHQATLFGPGARKLITRYASGFRLSADLDYFLRLSRYPRLSVQCLDLEIVNMADSGVSSQLTKLRLYEVYRAYHRAFGWLWFFPFILRYLRRFVSLLDRR